MFVVPETYRVRSGAGRHDSTDADGNNGLFIVKSAKLSNQLKVVAYDGSGWERVFVSLNHRRPSWEEMSHVKRLFWGPDELVVRYYLPEQDYINRHPHTLHLWRPKQAALPAPPACLVDPPQDTPEVVLDAAPAAAPAPPSVSAPQPDIGLNRTETLLAFVGWVLMRHRDKLQTIDADAWAELIAEFTAANALEPQRHDWTHRATIP
jgi:hypothetical protein